MRVPRVLVVLLATLMLAFPSLTGTAHADTTTSGSGYVTIPVDDDVRLGALVITPNGPGPHPLLVLPAAWGTNNLLYVGAGRRLAHESGYQVVSYTPRGFWDSGGGVDIAGPADVADARAVIDWAVENTDADPDAIGMAGISYGAGISLLTAATDERVRAVGAMSGWADLATSLYPNDTVSAQAVELLLLSAKLTGRPGEEMAHVEREYRRGNIQAALDMAQNRSVATRLDDLNAHQPAVMLAHAWNDGIFPPSQIVDLYTRLDTPKRLMLTPGDHATAEAFGGAGLPNEVWEDLTRWLDHHLRGVDNGIDTDQPVRLRANSAASDWAAFPDWEAVTADTTTLYLDQPRRSITQWLATGGMGPEPATGWGYGIRTGVGTTAHSGTLFLSGVFVQFADLPTGVALPLVNRDRAGVWTGPAYPDGATVGGTATVRVTVTPTHPDTSLFFYLYATNRHGSGALLTHQPHTLRDATPGEPVAVEVDLEPVVRAVPAGHHLTLVVDTMDPRYTSESRTGQRVEFGSPDDDPAWLLVPTT